MSSRTILIGLDGATFTVLDPLMERGVMPFLRDFVADGVRAPLHSVVPALTPPAWTSLMTGKRPGRHGVFDFFQKESPDSRYFRFAVSQDMRTPTIWSLASEEGRRVTALNFPLMFPPPDVNGCVVPGGWMPWRQLRLGCHPPDLFDRLKTLPSFNARELAMDMTLEEKALEGCADEEYAGWIELHTRRERRWFDILSTLMRDDPADLTAVLFDGVDKLQHLCWRFLDPACRGANPSPWERTITDLCEGYFSELDALIARIVALAGPEATVVLASDHGFGPTSDIFYVNTWLEQEGYLTWSGGLGAEPSDAANKFGIGKIARHVFEIDWERTAAYAATPSSQGIHIVRRRAEFGDPDSVRDELAEALRRLRHPETGRPVISEIWTREEAFPGPFAPMGPDLTIMLEGNGIVSILRSDSPFGRRPEPTGTHCPEGIFLARGPALRRGASLDDLSIVDVAPLLLHCLGVSIPDDFDGRLPASAFDPAELSRRPPRYSAARSDVEHAADAPEKSAADLVYDADEEAIVLKRLQALGYLE
ncbi:MAG TPA: alkaline phosphatase family protein [Isosphaeraceae bacterium]